MRKQCPDIVDKHYNTPVQMTRAVLIITEITEILLKIVEKRQTIYKCLNVFINYGPGYMNGDRVKGCKQDGIDEYHFDIFIVIGTHFSESDLIATLIHDCGHFITDKKYKEHGSRFLLNCALLMSVVVNLETKKYSQRHLGTI